MLTLAKAVALVGFVWAVAALAVQVWAARGGGRREFSRQAGSPAQGIWYIFTVAMLPAHKETARLHAAEFALGVVTHIGIGLSLIVVVLLLCEPAWIDQALSLTWMPLRVALAAGICLLLRRVLARDLRSISVPDDYLAIAATCGLLAVCAAAGTYAAGPTVALIYAGLLFVYLPLGKLRHVVFFFIARGDLGRRLGYRGVYPPARAGR